MAGAAVPARAARRVAGARAATRAPPRAPRPRAARGDQQAHSTDGRDEVHDNLGALAGKTLRSLGCGAQVYGSAYLIVTSISLVRVTDFQC